MPLIPNIPPDIIAQELVDLLNSAVKIEHSVMPPYCYALWSIKDKNSHLASTIRSVIREEMLHMAMVCNILNAMGAKPTINNKDKIPTYPHELPMKEKNDTPFLLHLDKLSMRSISNFMHIELPKSFDWSWMDKHDHTWSTIGEFYMDIQRHIMWLTDDYFRHGRQILRGSTPKKSGELIFVNSVPSAIAVANEIMFQGEGVDMQVIFSEGEECHYDSFKNIYYEMGGTAEFDSENFDEETCAKSYDANKYEEFQKKIWNVVRDPINNNPTHEHFIRANMNFNSAYSRMLDEMHNTFNCEHPDIAKSAELMFAMERCAFVVMTIPLDPEDLSKGFCGPTFEYIEPSNRVAM